MQISTTQLYDRSASLMARLTEKANDLQTQISTNSKIATASDDVAGWTQLARLKQAASDDTAYGTNLTMATSLLQQTDTGLGSIEAQLQQAIELATQANGGALSADNKATLATQFDSIRTALAGIANQTDLRGAPLFGATVDASATAGATFTGVQDPSAIPIGAGQTVQATETASRVFQVTLPSGQTSDAFAILKRLSAALTSGNDPDAIKSATDDLNAALDQVTAVHGAVGARASRVDMEQSRLTTVATDREATRSSLEEPDIATTITELQKTMTVLSATQASFTKLSSLSLFDYLK